MSLFQRYGNPKFLPVAVLGVFLGGSVAVAQTAPPQPAPSRTGAGATTPVAASSGAMSAATPVSDLARRGEYLARAGDCFSCHASADGPALSGGRQLQTPYGTIGAPNITPDRETGIGAWSDDDFWRLMHEGLDREGHYVYPVMPFDHYTKVTRDDAMAIKAFLFSQPAVHAPNPPNHLHFPFNIRASLGAWRTLFFRPAEFAPDPARSAEENRGAYLIEGLGHCGACHTPRNILSGSKKNDALGGGEITGQGWFAPNITSDVREGIGGWSEADLVAYLKTGVAKDRAIVAGPMAEVVHTSLSHLSDADLHAIAAALKASPAKALYKETHLVASPASSGYLDHCAFCHQPDGKGIPGAVPPLAGNGAVLAGGPDDMIRTVLGGLGAHGDYAPMPGFATTLPAEQIVDIVTYVRGAWGNAAPATATVGMVNGLAGTTKTMLAGTGGCETVQPPALAAAIGGGDIEPMLHEVNDANMVERIDAILPRLKGNGNARADLVNGLTAAWCPIVMGDTARPPAERLRLLNRFAMQVYTRLASGEAGAPVASVATPVTAPVAKTPGPR